MNMFKPTTAKTPEEYIDLIDEPRRSEIKKLDEFIRKTIPEKTLIVAGMLGYGMFHYKSKSGREGDWPIIALASQKHYISIYVCASDGEKYIAEEYKDKLPKASIGKSCIRFTKFENIDFPLLTEIIKKGYKMMESQKV